MEIKAQSFELKLTFDELWEIFFIQSKSIKYSIITHWVNHPEVWKTHEKQRLYWLELTANKLGENHLYNNALLEFDELLQKEITKLNTK